MARICILVDSGGIGYCLSVESIQGVLIHHSEYIFGKSLLVPPSGSSDR